MADRVPRSEHLTSHPWRKVYADFHAERIRAYAKFLGHSREEAHWTDQYWLPVLVEEVGEVARVLCDVPLGVIPNTEARARLREELVQVGAMAAAWIGAIDDVG